MRTCHICKKTFCKPYNLRRHLSLFHPGDPPLKLERMSRHNGYEQQGGASKNIQSDEEDMTSDDGSDVSNAQSEESSDDEMDSVNKTGDVDESNNADDEDENEVFDRLLHTINSNDDNNDETAKPNLKERQKMFREKYAEFLIWLYRLKRNSIHKKIMETVKELMDGPLEYDREEAIHAAIQQRKFLLDGVYWDRARDDDDLGISDDEDDQ